MNWRRELGIGLALGILLWAVSSFLSTQWGRIATFRARQCFYGLLGAQSDKAADPLDKHYALPLNVLIDENKRLNELLSLSDRVSSRAIGARTLARDPNTWWSQLLVEFKLEGKPPKGIALVLTPQGAIGTLDSRTVILSGDESTLYCLGTVSLLSSAKTQLSVEIGESRIPFLLEGRGGPTFSLRPILNGGEARVRPGDLIYSSEPSKIFTRGLPLGRVEEDVRWGSFTSLGGTPSEVLLWWK